MEKFKLQQLQPNIYLITETYLTDYANMFLITGDDEALLIDCGMGLFDIKEFLSEQGFKNVKVIVTHTHFDHVGGLQYFTPDEIVPTDAIAINLQNEDLLGLKYIYRRMINKKIMKLFDDRSVRQICKDYHEQLINLLPKLQPKMDPSKIQLGEFNFQIIPVPGHSDESIVLYEPGKQLLFSGDTLYDGKMLYTLPNSSVAQFIASLSHLQQLPIQTCFPGHNQILDQQNTQIIIQRWLQKLQGV